MCNTCSKLQYTFLLWQKCMCSPICVSFINPFGFNLKSNWAVLSAGQKNWLTKSVSWMVHMVPQLFVHCNNVKPGPATTIHSCLSRDRESTWGATNHQCISADCKHFHSPNQPINLHTQLKMRKYGALFWLHSSVMMTLSHHNCSHHTSPASSWQIPNAWMGNLNGCNQDFFPAEWE
jgi:hypothetical protein